MTLTSTQIVALHGPDRAFLYDVPDYASFLTEHAYAVYRDHGTLFLISGYAFVAYGAGGFFDNIVFAVHMRRHYFQIGLLLHLELASLLSFSSRITRAVAMSGEREKFEGMMHTIEDEYLRFLHRFRFTGASNDLQAQQLTAMWRKHLRLPEIFEDLHTEITSATEYLFNRAALRQARTVERLTIIGTFGLVAGLTFTLLGAVLAESAEVAAVFHGTLQALGLSAGPHAAANHVIRRGFGDSAMLFAPLALFALCTLWVLRLFRKRADDAAGRQGGSVIDRTISAPLWGIAGVATLLAVACLAIAVLSWQW